MLNKNEKIKTVQTLLLRYTEPKPMYNGFNAWDIAEIMVNAIEDKVEDRVIASLDRLTEKHLKDKKDD